MSRENIMAFQDYIIANRPALHNIVSGMKYHDAVNYICDEYNIKRPADLEVMDASAATILEQIKQKGHK